MAFIIVRTLKNACHTINVEPSTTVGMIKQILEEKSNVGNREHQKLIHSGKILSNNDQLISELVKTEDDKSKFVVMCATPRATVAPISVPVSAPIPIVATPEILPISTILAEKVVSAPTPTIIQTSAVIPTTPVVTTITAIEPESDMSKLLELGFSQDLTAAALRASFNDLNRAADYLYSGLSLKQLQDISIRNGIPSTANTLNASNTADMHFTVPPIDQGQSMDPMPLNSMPSMPSMPSAQEMAGMSAMLQSNPQMMDAMIQMAVASNPQLKALYDANPEAVKAMIMQLMASGGAGLPDFGNLDSLDGHDSYQP